MSALEQRTVLITGANSGIGLAMAHAVGQAGADVIIWGRRADVNDAAVAALDGEGIRAAAWSVDVADEAAVEAGFAAAIDWSRDGIDSVIANAGTSGNGERFPDTTLDEWHRVMSINLDGVFLTMRAGARHMIDRGRGGSLVAVSSTSSIHGAAGNEAYGTSKTALLGLVRATAVGLARHEIRVNALLPGWTKTDLASFAWQHDKFREATLARTPVRRWAEPDEMSAAAVYLADPRHTFHTGDSITVDGGYTIF